MIKVLGVIILLYGLVGVIGSYLAYRALLGPVGKLKDELGLLAQRLTGAVDAVKAVRKVLADKIEPLLQSIGDQVGHMASGVGQIAGFFGHEADQLRQIGTECGQLTIPVLTAGHVHHKLLDLDVSMDLLSGVELKKYDVLGTTVYGPPLTLQTRTYTLLNLGAVNVITSLDIQNVAPLQPLGAVFDVAGAGVDAVRDGLNTVKGNIDGVTGFFGDQAQATGEAAQQLDELGGNLDKIRNQMSELSHSRVPDLVPLGLIGYFALIHLAFALTGLALLLV